MTAMLLLAEAQDDGGAIDPVALYAAIVATLALGASIYQLRRQYRQRVNFVDPDSELKDGCAVFHVRLANRSQHDIRIIQALLQRESPTTTRRALRRGRHDEDARKHTGVGAAGVQIGLIEDLPLQVGARDGKRFRVWAVPDALQDVNRVRVILRTGAHDTLRSGWIKVPVAKSPAVQPARH